MPEGTFVVAQPGRAQALASGDWIFVFRAQEERRLKPMVLLPSQSLQRLQRFLADRSEPVTLRISGQVFSYGSLNYLLPSAYSVDRDQPSVPAAPTKPEATDDEQVSTAASSDPAVDDLIAELELQRRRPRALEAEHATPTQDKAPAPRADTLPEGTQILQRRARLVRNDTASTLVFEAGAAGATSIDRPLRLLPSRLRERMEAWAGQLGDTASFTVSGVVYAHEGTNYLLPTAFTQNRPGDVAPRQ